MPRIPSGPGRRPETPATLLASLSRALSRGRPAWVSAPTWTALTAAHGALRADALAVRERGSLDATADALDVAPATLDRWIAEGVL